MTTPYAGAAWLSRCLVAQGDTRPLSPLAVKVADLLGELVYGLYHLDRVEKPGRTDWTDPHHISVLWPGDMATFDFDRLTRLVFLAHREGVRVSVEPCNMAYLRLRFHDRSVANQHGSRIHPTLAEAVSAFEHRQAAVIPYVDPEHPWNGPSYYTGKHCIERGCTRPAGTVWSKLWCQPHNAERMARISAALDTMIQAGEEQQPRDPQP